MTLDIVSMWAVRSFLAITDWADVVPVVARDSDQMDDEREIEKLVRRLIDTWNNCDAAGFAAMFVPSAEYVTGQGQCICGRDNIAELVRHASAGSPVSLVEGPSIECDGVAGTMRFAWAMAEKGALARRGIVACTLVRQEAGWLIKALHNKEGAMSRPSPTPR
jgi:uncharacterized protein (TIGR02246 family)